MPELESAVRRVNDESQDEEGYVLISADRTEAEKRAAYAVEWQEPANKLTFIDRLRSLF